MQVRHCTWSQRLQDNNVPKHATYMTMLCTVIICACELLIKLWNKLRVTCSIPGLEPGADYRSCGTQVGTVTMMLLGIWPKKHGWRQALPLEYVNTAGKLSSPSNPASLFGHRIHLPSRL